MKVTIKPFVKGHGPLGNIILSTLLEAGSKGSAEPIKIKELAAACDVEVPELVEKLEEITGKGTLVKRSLLSWEQLSTFNISRITIELNEVQAALPEVNKSTKKSEKPKLPSLADLMSADTLEFECGTNERVVETPDGPGPGTQRTDTEPIVFRIGLVNGDEADTAILSFIEKFPSWEDGIDENTEGAFKISERDGWWRHIVQGKVFGPHESRGTVGAREEAIAWIKEALIPFKPTEAQREQLGIELNRMQALEIEEGGQPAAEKPKRGRKPKKAADTKKEAS